MINTQKWKALDLKKYSAIRIGPKIKYLEIKELSEIPEIVKLARKKKLKIFILGECTNTYFAKVLSKYLILKLNFFGVNITRESGTTVEIDVGASENWHGLVRYSLKKNFWGLENLSYIPGSVGAAPVQNIGAYGVELKDIFISTNVFDTKKNKFITFSKKNCQFAYRDSVFKKHKNRYVIVSVKLRLSKIPKPILNYKPLDILKINQKVNIGQISNLVIATRKAKLPDYNKFPNCGSFFKNPIISFILFNKIQKKYPNIPFFKTEKKIKIPAAWLIENVAKMKGRRNKNVGTWPNQPLVLVNYKNATSLELNNFVKIIQKKIAKETGILLEQEVNFVN